MSPVYESDAEQGRQWRLANPDRKRETDRQYREAHKEAEAERNRRWRAARAAGFTTSAGGGNNKIAKFSNTGSPDYRKVRRLAEKHGMTLEQQAEMWESQGRCCYLCERPLSLNEVVIDHDHRCCPQRRSCAFCRRGLACPPCNKLIGFAGDDAEVLRLIVANLRIATASVTKRLRTKPRQLELDIA